MKKIKNLLMLLAAIFMFAPYISVFAEPQEKTEIKTISVTSEKKSVELDEHLSTYTVETTTEGITIEEYGSNTRWLKRGPSDSSWNGWGSDTPIADDEETHYALRLMVSVDDQHFISNSLNIVFNDEQYNSVGYTEFNSQDWGGYLIIDLGTPTEASEPEDPEEPEEPTYYTVKFDLNGAKWADEYYEEEYADGIQSQAGEQLTVEAPERYIVIPPKLKEFNGYEIGGQRFAPGEELIVKANVTVKFLWKDVEDTEDYSVNNDDFDVTLDFTEVAGEDFELYIETLNGYTDESIEEECEGSAECIATWNENIETARESIKKETKDLGEFIDLYFIHLEGEDGEYREGPFKIKIKMTDEMKKYNAFKMVYMKQDYNTFEATEEVVELTVNGDYLEGTLDHLSGYALVGSVEEAPETGDNVIIYIILGLLSLGGLASVRRFRKTN